MEQVDTFTINSTLWVACEDLQQPGGSIALVSSDEGRTEWFEKSYAPYKSSGTDDSEYYLGLTKQTVQKATTDVGDLPSLLSWSAAHLALHYLLKMVTLYTAG